MVNFGYTLMTEQSGPKELVNYAVSAEQLGFDFEVSSDHYFPWLEAMGHSPYAWTLLGAVAQATERVGLMTYVTCPTVRYHPAVVAQKAATLAILSDGRFTLGLGAGENLNEHVAGEGWQAAAVRQDRLVDATEIISALFTGEMVSMHTQHFHVDSAKLWDLPDERCPIGIAVSGPEGIERFAPLADHLIATEPKPELIEQWDAERGSRPASRKIAQVPISWDPDKGTAITRAHELFRWFGLGWRVNADLPTPAAFDAASQFVREDDIATSIGCGPDLDELVETVKPYWEAGFTDIAIVQIGDSKQQEFLDKAAGPLLEKLRIASK